MVWSRISRTVSKNAPLVKKYPKPLIPRQQVIKLSNDELSETPGEPSTLNLKGERPHTIMLVGLQGSGKTTAAAKRAKRSQGESNLSCRC